jgi:hypothetical protein
MALQSHAALAEIRDSLLETYLSNDAMNQLILSQLDPRAWRALPPGQKGNGRTIAALFAHLHNSRLVWLKNSAPHLKCPPPLDPRRCTMKQAAAAHKRSAAQCHGMIADALSAAPDRRVSKFSRGSWTQTWPAGGTMFRLHVLARGASSRSDFDAGPSARLPRPRQNSRHLALGEALETSWPYHAPALSGSRPPGPP